MSTKITPLAEVVAWLLSLKGKQIANLSVESGVSESTIWKIRLGYVANPGIETVAALSAHMPAAPAPLPVATPRRQAPAKVARALRATTARARLKSALKQKRRVA